jgi:hypothetical protein
MSRPTITTYEVVICHGQGLQEVIPVKHHYNACECVKSYFRDDTLATMVFVRQYYTDRRGHDTFRVLHKNTLRREL